jgi:hypothetical protein
MWCRFHIQLAAIFDKEALHSHCHISFINRALEVLPWYMEQSIRSSKQRQSFDIERKKKIEYWVNFESVEKNTKD